MLAIGWLGLIAGDLLSQALLIGWLRGAVPWQTAPGLVVLAEGSTSQAVAAASMAQQSSLGLICAPVANRVEAPCLGNNAVAAANALVCANMALADFDPVIPLDEVISTADRVGRSLPRELRCTALGGLSTTDTSLKLQEQLAQRKAHSCGGHCGLTPRQT